MLTQIYLKHFKCFKTINFPLSPLTILTGTNASGKSSVIQAMVLLNQTIRENEWSDRLTLKGSSVDLGSVADVVDQVNGRNSFEIGLSNDNNSIYNWRFEGVRDEKSMRIANIQYKNKYKKLFDYNIKENTKFFRLMPENRTDNILAMCLSGLTYLSAERTGPHDLHTIDERFHAPVVGPFGENTVSVLDANSASKVLKKLVKPDVNTLYTQTKAWMNEFFPGFDMKIDRLTKTNIFKLGMRTSIETDFLPPANTGFGLTQILPIIIAVLSSKPNDLLLIESPELHLHPRGQSKMGEFLAQAASAGIQVILETHSDHVINGIRRVVKDGNLPPNDVALHFLRSRGEVNMEGGSQIQSMDMDENGSIDSWPKGFFDQFDQDIYHLIGWD